MDSYDEPISDNEKVRIVSEFILKAPPGEFNEVFNDVRVLLNNDTLLKEGVSGAFAQYNKDQFTQCKIRGAEEAALITDFADRGNGQFLDPRSKQIIKYDHLRKEAVEFEAATVDRTSEPWRSTVEAAFTEYVHQHYKGGAVSVYGSSSGDLITLTVCIESHQFNPSNFWNGRWRSQYSVTFPASGGGGTADVQGVYKVQVHYYEEGNVQLVSSKDIKEQLKITTEQNTARDFVKLVFDAESEYQKAISENYISMSSTTFKALRRQLPVTRSKIDWAKIGTYKIGNELKNN